MQFTGSELMLKRSFYTQNDNFGFIANISVDNTTGRYEFGVSGESATFPVVLQSGRISVGNLFLHTYVPYEPFSVECQISTNSFNVLKDGSPMVFGAGQPTSDYSYLYFSRDSASLGATFDFYVSGQNTPNVTINDKGYLLSSSQTVVTGFLNNNGAYPVRVFSSNAQPLQDLDFGALANSDVPAGDKGAFTFTGGWETYNFSQPILVNLVTNYGDSTVSFKIVDARSYYHFVFLQNIPSYAFNAQNVLSRTLSYSNFSGGLKTNSFPANLSFSLDYISGSGYYSTPDFIDGANYSTVCTGLFSQSGILLGQALIPTGNGNLSGVYIINVSRFGWATGAVTGTFSGMGTGLSSANGYTGVGYGNVTGTITGLIQDGSGTFFFNSLASGYGFNAVSAGYSGYINATGFLSVSGLRNGDSFYVGVMSAPLIKGIQFFNETGLAAYLNNTPEHKVTATTSGNLVYLGSRHSGSLGNGTFIQPNICDYGSMLYSPFLTGGQDVGSTGIAVTPIGPFFAPYTTTLTGSGDYSVLATGFADGDFYYTKTFTGQWDILTGVSMSKLVSLKRAGNYTSTVISGETNLPPNSSVAFQIVHNSDSFSADTALLTISGADVLNPISQIISN